MKLPSLTKHRKDVLYLVVITLLIVFLVLSGVNFKGKIWFFEIDFTQENVDMSEQLAKWSTDSSEMFALEGWLNSYADMYSIRKPSIAIALRDKSCGNLPYDRPDSMSVAEFMDRRRECARNTVNEELRELANDKRYPFHDYGKKIRATIPDRYPESGSIYVCDRKDLNKSFIIYNSENNREISVMSTGTIGNCSSLLTSLHLNMDDGQYMFGGNTRVGDLYIIEV